MAQAERAASWEDIISAAAKAGGVNPALALAVANKESSLNPDAVGDGGQAIGLFQLHPGAATDTGTADRHDPLQNIQGGVAYLKLLSDRYQGDLHKTLMAYNGGMAGVDADDPSPQAQAYATFILSKLNRETAKTPSPQAQVPAGATVASSGPPKPSFDPLSPDVALKPLLEAGAGAVRGAVSTVQTLASPIRRAFGMEPATPPPEETTTAGRVGRGLEQIGEFFVPAAAITKGAKGAMVAQRLAAKGLPKAPAGLIAASTEGAAQGAAAYGLSKTQGADESGARMSAAVSAVAPVAVKAIELGAPAIRAKAVKKLSQVFTTGMESKSPMLSYAIKTGDAATPLVARDVEIVRRAASETLDLPIQASWGKWQTMLAKDAAAKGKTLGDALKTKQFGQVPLPKAQILKALDDLENESAKHFAQVSRGGFKYLPYDQPLLKEIGILKETLGQYHDTITVKNLVDLKRVWDKAVFNLSTAGKVGVGPDVLVSNAMKEAAYTGANAIRDALQAGAPEIAQLNEAVSHAIQLQDLVAKLYKVNPAMTPTKKFAITVAGGGLGFAAGSTVGHPYMIMGAGSGLARVLERAMESPLWQTASPMLKGKLANAVANGNVETARRLLAPFLSGSATQQAQSPAEAKP